MMEDSYTSNKPALYTTVVVLVFIFTAMVFVSTTVSYRGVKTR
jgi:hypothetical protein